MPAVDLLGEGTVAAQAAKAHPVMANLDRLEHHRRAAHAAPHTAPGPIRDQSGTKTPERHQRFPGGVLAIPCGASAPSGRAARI